MYTVYIYISRHFVAAHFVIECGPRVDTLPTVRLNKANFPPFLDGLKDKMFQQSLPLSLLGSEEKTH